MNLNIILEIAISLVFVFALLSMIVSAVNEIILHFLNFRGKFLYNALEEVFKDKAYNINYMDRLYSHPGIDRLKKTAARLPSYISSRSFGKTLIDVVASEYDKNRTSFKQDPATKEIEQVAPPAMNTYEKFSAALNEMEHSDVKILLGTFVSGSKDHDSLLQNVETWYNDYMERVGGWYKTNLQKWLVVIGIAVAFIINVDSIKLINYLSKNDVVREQVVKGAEAWVDQQMKKDSSNIKSAELKDLIEQINKANEELGSYDLPLGTNKYTTDGFSFLPRLKKTNNEKEIPSSFLGILITGFAISYGAPFWFEMLNKLINTRRSGPRPKTDPNTKP